MRACWSANTRHVEIRRGSCHARRPTRGDVLRAREAGRARHAGGDAERAAAPAWTRPRAGAGAIATHPPAARAAAGRAKCRRPHARARVDRHRGGRALPSVARAAGVVDGSIASCLRHARHGRLQPLQPRRRPPPAVCQPRHARRGRRLTSPRLPPRPRSRLLRRTATELLGRTHRRVARARARRRPHDLRRARAPIHL